VPPPPAPQCSDGIDNDNDGKIDVYNDPGCASAQDNDETDPFVSPLALPQCSDATDNDGDGKVDYPADLGCTSATDNDEIDPPATLAASTPRRTLLSPFPVVRLVGRILRSGVHVTLLGVQAPAGSQVKVTCRGRGHSCPAAAPARTSTGARLRFRAFQRDIRAGTILRIFVTKQGFVGKYTRFTIRRGAAPSRVDGCAGTGTRVVDCP
jgi:hypothetical protein